MSPKLGFQYDDMSVDYLIDRHYREAERPFRSCQPRDLLLQVRNYCAYRIQPRKMSPEAFDFAVENYFSVMEDVNEVPAVNSLPVGGSWEFHG